MSTKRTSLIEVIDAANVSRLADTYHCLPGIVIAYYPSTFEADVQIAINDPRFDPDTSERIDEPWPIWPRMRVAWPRFGGAIFAGPLLPGDHVQVWWQDLEDGEYRGTGIPTSPQTTRRHGSQGAFCLPFDVTDQGVAVDATPAGVGPLWGYDGLEGQIRLLPTGVQLGRVGTDFVAKGVSLASAIAAAASAAAAAAVAGDGGAAAFAAFGASMAASASTYTSTIVKTD